MGGRVGYEYHYRFWVEDEMVELYKSKEDEFINMHKFKVDDGMKRFLFEMRTNFVVKRRPDEGGFDEILDSERFDNWVSEEFRFIGLEDRVGPRLREYWMTSHEIIGMAREAFDFAKQMAAADPRLASLRLIPIVVGLDVCTVQQEGEPITSTIDRAIRSQNLIPLYLSLYKDQEQPMYRFQALYLRRLPRIRVEEVEQGLAWMQTCQFCSRRPTIGAQMTSLPCRHAFHSHCIIKYLETNKFCPVCHSPAHSYSYLMQCISHGSHLP